MDAAALASAIGGSAVALAAIAASEFRSTRDRESRETLALAQQSHERALQLFPKKCDAYDSMLAHVRTGSARMEVPEPSPFRAQPSQLGPTDWDWLQVRLAAYGSPEVVEAFEQFARAWWLYLRMTEGETAPDPAALKKLREQAGATADKIRALVRADFAGAS